MLLCSSTLYLHLSCKFPISIFGITPPPIRKWIPYRVAHTIYMTFFFLSVFIFRFFFVILRLVLSSILFYFLSSLSYSTSLPLCPSSTKVNGKWYGGKMYIPAYNADYTYYITSLLLFPYFNHCNFLSLSVFFFLLYFLFQLSPSCFFPFFYFLSLSSFFSSLYLSSSFSLFMLLFFRIYFWSLSLPEGMKLQNGNINMKIEYIYIIWNKKINSGQINFYAIYAAYLSDNSAENK